jgi:hypothetical protein
MSPPPDVRALTRRAVLAMESGQRYLTPATKVAVLEEWLANREQPVPAHAGGLGYPDRGVFALTDQINAFDHVQTLQSCSGHEVPCTNPDPGECHGATGPHTFTYNGQLWLWLTEATAGRAYLRLPEIVKLPKVETTRVHIIGEQEILDVIYEGNEPGVEMPELVDWLGSLA